jgi:hypothetical protein
MTVTWKKMITLALACAAGSALWALPDQGGVGRSGGGRAVGGGGVVRPSGGGFQQHAPLTINMGHSSSGGHNRNYPSQYQGLPRAGVSPSWGQVYRPAPQGRRPGGKAPSAAASALRAVPAPGAVAGQRTANAVHHHAYTQGYIRQRLQKMGVKAEPSYITDRAEMIHTDRAHSTIKLPTTGPDGKAYGGKVITPRGADAGRLRDRLNAVSSVAWRGNVDKNNRE